MKNAIDRKFLPGLRWAMLRTCRVGGHLGVTDAMLLEVVRSEYIVATKETVRTEMHYLEDRKLINISRSEIEPWRATLTRYGYDVADYVVDCAPGINRPPQIDA